MAVKTILIAAFAALVAAVPQHAEHLGKAQVARSSNIFARSELLGRTVSYDGSCGSWSGMTCPDNGCCSSQGWCGSSSIHCGAGCQAGFGQCGSGSESTPAVQPATVQAPTVAEAQPAAVVAPVADTPAAAPVVAPVVAPAASPVVAPVVAPAPAPVTTTTSTPTPTPTPTPAAAPVTVPAEQVKGNGAASPKQTVSGTDSSTSTSSTNSGLGDTYKLYTGDGSMAAGWPAQSSWMDFDSAFEANRGLMKQSCAQFGAANNNDDEINNLKSALQSVGSSSGVDARYLLAIVMQESGGCVRAPTTNYGVRNPGLFQSHDGSGTCNDSGNAQNPCPMSSITQMITDGAAGTAAGDGLKQTLLQAGTSDASKYYRAARIYNSGSIAASGQLQDGIATHCYSSDVANRLTGWVHAAHGCSQ